MASSLDDSARTVSGPDASGTCAAAGDANHLPPAETTDKPDADAAFVVHGYKLYAIMVGICFGAFMMSLDVFVIATVITTSTRRPKRTPELTY